MQLDPQLEHLADQACRGDRTAFEAIVKRCAKGLEAFIRSQTTHDLQARLGVEELQQETLLKAFASIGRFEWQGDGSFQAWLHGLAMHVIKDALRQLRGHAGEEALDCIAGDDPTPSKVLCREERFQDPAAAFQRLSPDHQRVIHLLRIEGLTIQETAARLHRSPDAVKQLLARRRRCRESGCARKRGLADVVVGPLRAA